MIRRTFRLFVSVGTAAVVTIGGAACSDDDGNVDPTSTQSARTPVATSVVETPAAGSPEATPGQAGTPAGGQEVVGIVGAVNQAENRIEINRLSGADVTVVLVTPTTRILSPRGRALVLSSLRPSDRIIANGDVADGEMTADRVEIQPVRPGASPGG